MPSKSVFEIFEKYLWNSFPSAFDFPKIWRKPKNRVSDCYFYLVKTACLTAKTKKNTVYPNLVSAMQQVQHSDNIAIPYFNGLCVTNESDITDSGDVPLFSLSW